MQHWYLTAVGSVVAAVGVLVVALGVYRLTSLIGEAVTSKEGRQLGGSVADLQACWSTKRAHRLGRAIRSMSRSYIRSLVSLRRSSAVLAYRPVA